RHTCKAWPPQYYPD
ncbi:hypothetical protein EC80586_3948, partial [Escherichia coli 8.0586]